MMKSFAVASRHLLTLIVFVLLVAPVAPARADMGPWTDWEEVQPGSGVQWHTQYDPTGWAGKYPFFNWAIRNTSSDKIEIKYTIFTTSKAEGMVMDTFIGPGDTVNEAHWFSHCDGGHIYISSTVTKVQQ